MELGNSPSGVAFFMRLSLKDESDELLTPVFWEDNYLTLMPGEKRIVKCVIPSTTIYKDKVTLIVAGWNVNEKKINLSLAESK